MTRQHRHVIGSVPQRWKTNLEHVEAVKKILPETAVFDVTNANLVQDVIAFPGGFFPVGTISGYIKLDTAHTDPALLANLNGYSTGGSLFLTYNGILVSTNGVNGSAVLSGGQTASFTATTQGTLAIFAPSRR